MNESRINDAYAYKAKENRPMDSRRDICITKKDRDKV